MPQQKSVKNWKHADDTRSVLFWVKKDKFDAWKKTCDKFDITMTDLIIRGVDDKIAEYELGKVQKIEQESLRNHQVEIMNRLAEIDAKIAQNKRDEPIMQDDHARNQVKGILKQHGATTEEDLAVMMDMERDSMIDLLDVMQGDGEIKSDAYGRWDLA